MVGQIFKKSRVITGASLISVMLLNACGQAIVLTPGAVSKADNCSQFRQQISDARRTELDKQAEGAAVGALFGAVLGAAMAGPDNRARGALIGAGIGGLTGYSSVYSQQVQSRSSDADSLLRNINSDAGKERALVTQTGRATVSLQGCRRSQLASLKGRVTSGSVENATAKAELRQIKSWVAGDNRIVSAAFNGIGKRVDAYVDVTSATANAQSSISQSGAKSRTPNVSRVQSERTSSVNAFNRTQQSINRDIEVLDVLLG